MESWLLTRPETLRELVLPDRWDADELSVNLVDAGLHRVRTVVFRVPGNVVKMKGQFQHLVEFDCCRQGLTTTEGLHLPHCRRVFLSHNALVFVDVHALAPRVVTLSLSHNRLETVRHLSLSLETVTLDHNRLREVDLHRLDALRHLDVRFNPYVHLVRVPLTLRDVRIDQSSTTGMGYDTGFPHQNNNNNNKEDNHTEYREALLTFFRLRHEYDNQHTQHNQKGRCVQCQRPVGTVFATSDTEFQARCGDKVHPCPLHIHLFRGDVVWLPDAVEAYRKELTKSEDAVVLHQLDVLFGYDDVSSGEEDQDKEDKEDKEREEEEETKQTKQKKQKKQVKETLLEYETDKSLYDQLLDAYVAIHFDPAQRVAQRAQHVDFLKNLDRCRGLETMYRQSEDSTVLQELVVLQEAMMAEGTAQPGRRRGVVVQEKCDNNVRERTAPIRQDDYVLGEPPRVVAFHYTST